VIYTSTDNNVVWPTGLVKVDSQDSAGGSDTDSVKRGAIAAFGINYRDLGEQTGRIVARILKGEKPGDIKPEISTKMELFVNPGAAEKQGVKLSDALVKSAAQVVQ
jgi:putative ABC transport system substrate-binding protein